MLNTRCGFSRFSRPVGLLVGLDEQDLVSLLEDPADGFDRLVRIALRQHIRRKGRLFVLRRPVFGAMGKRRTPCRPSNCRPAPLSSPYPFLVIVFIFYL
jgi:hypothetical protein